MLVDFLKMHRAWIAAVGLCLLAVVAAAYPSTARRFAAGDKSSAALNPVSPPVRQGKVRPIDVYVTPLGEFEPDDITIPQGRIFLTVHDVSGRTVPSRLNLVGDGKTNALNAVGTVSEADLTLVPGVFVLSDESREKSGQCRITVVRE